MKAERKRFKAFTQNHEQIHYKPIYLTPTLNFSEKRHGLTFARRHEKQVCKFKYQDPKDSENTSLHVIDLFAIYTSWLFFDTFKNHHQCNVVLPQFIS